MRGGFKMQNNIKPVNNKELAEMILNLEMGECLDFYQNYDEKSNKTSDAYGVKLIQEFDATMIILNYYSGGIPYIMDITREDEKERIQKIGDALHSYFNYIGFHKVYVRLP
jgi:hypothetical protein